MANHSQKKISFELCIKSARISLPNETKITVYWIRGNSNVNIFLGDKKIDTKSRPLLDGKAVFNDKFAMKTMLEYDYNTGKYVSKPVSFSLN